MKRVIEYWKQEYMINKIRNRLLVKYSFQSWKRHVNLIRPPQPEVIPDGFIDEEKEIEDNSNFFEDEDFETLDENY